MKKKILALAVIAIMAVGFGGCGGNATTKIDSAVAMANPWEVVTNMEEARTKLGFVIEGYADVIDEDVISVCVGVNAIEVMDEDGNYLRKAKDDGDISGDYEKYPYEGAAEADGIQAVVKGDDADSIYVVTWRNGEFSYAYGTEEPITALEAAVIIKAVK